MSTCQQCGKPAIVILSDGIPLCLNCYEKFVEINQRQLDRLEEESNYLTDMMELTSGVYGVLPRYKIYKPIIQKGDVTYNNINVNRSIIGSINTGDVKKIDVAIDNIKYGGDEELANSLKNFTEAVINEKDLDEKIKNNVLKNIAFLSSQANLPKENRKNGIIKSVLTGIRHFIVSSAALISLWDNLQHILVHIFN